MSCQIYTELFKKLSPVVYQQVIGMTGSTWHAEEIVQEVFMKAWIHREKLTGIENINSWFFIVTKRMVFNYVMKRSREKKFFTSYQQAPGLTYAEDSLLPEKCRRLLAEAEKKLTPRQKEVYYLKYIKGMKQEQIADCLHISKFTALHHIKDSVSIVREYVLMKLEMGERKRA